MSGEAILGNQHTLGECVVVVFREAALLSLGMGPFCQGAFGRYGTKQERLGGGKGKSEGD